MAASIMEMADVLSGLGLTGTQAKIYIAIAQIGVSTVGQVSKFAKVRREDVYRVVPTLEKMGLIERVLGTPVKMKAIPVEEALNILVKREEEDAAQKASDMKAKADAFLARFKKHAANTLLEQEGSTFSLVQGKAALLSKISTMVKNAERQFDIMMSGKKLVQLLYECSDLLGKAVKKGVTVRIIAEKSPEADDMISKTIKDYKWETEAVDLQSVERLPSHCMIVDAKEAFVTTRSSGGLGESPSLWTNDPGMVELLQKNFGDVWFFACMHWAHIEVESLHKKSTAKRRT